MEQEWWFYTTENVLLVMILSNGIWYIWSFISVSHGKAAKKSVFIGEILKDWQLAKKFLLITSQIKKSFKITYTLKCGTKRKCKEFQSKEFKER